MDGVVGQNGQNVQLHVGKAVLNAQGLVSSLKVAKAIMKTTSIVINHLVLVWFKLILMLNFI